MCFTREFEYEVIMGVVSQKLDRTLANPLKKLERLNTNKKYNLTLSYWWLSDIHTLGTLWYGWYGKYKQQWS